MIVECSETRHASIRLRQQVHFWRAQHARAVAREAVWGKRALQAEHTVRQQTAQLAEEYQQIEALKAKIVWLQQQLFGRKTEQTKSPAHDFGDGGQKYSDSSEKRRTRGKQPGTKGHGRKCRTQLPAEEVQHDLPPAEKCCPVCRMPYEIFPETEDSDEIHWDVKLTRRVHKRRRYLRTCTCTGVSRIVTAPIPPKLIPKGMCSTGFWVQIILEKFLFQRPLYRILKALELEGLTVSQGTITGGLKRIGKVLQPLYPRILERNRAANHWHIDETKWMLFAVTDGKKGHRWVLWVFVSRDTCVYILDPSRSSRVPRDHLGEDAEGIASVDRYAAYKKLGIHILLAYCWSHVRRDFIQVWEGYNTLRPWADAWIAHIRTLYRLNDDRLQVISNPELFREKDQLLREAIASMTRKRDRQLANKTLHPLQKKVLNSMCTHWKGLTLFVEHPEIPMDNNEAERCLRTPVVGRKNYYGNNSLWSGMLTAALFTIIQTLLKNHISPKKFLLAYFDACAKNGGSPPENIDAFLPWNMSDEQKTAFRYPEQPP